jgi:hypothetical protein
VNVSDLFLTKRNFTVFEDGTVSFHDIDTGVSFSSSLDELPAIDEKEQERVRLRDRRIKLLPEQLNALMLESLASTQTRTKPSDSAKPYNGGPFLPWQELPPSATPAVTLAVDSPKLLINEAHADRVHQDVVLGAYCGIPIVQLDTLGVEVDHAVDVATLCGPTRPYLVWYDLTDVEYGIIKQSTHDSVPPEILPGEERCADGIIRRTTTAEALGYDDYHNALLEEKPREELVEEHGTSSWLWWDDVEKGIASGHYTPETAPRYNNSQGDSQ